MYFNIDVVTRHGDVVVFALTARQHMEPNYNFSVAVSESTVNCSELALLQIVDLITTKIREKYSNITVREKRKFARRIALIAKAMF